MKRRGTTEDETCDPDKTIPPALLNRRGMNLLQVGSYHKAERYFEAIKEARPDLPSGYEGIAWTRYLRGDYVSSLEAWNALLERFPGSPSAVYRRCLAWEKLKHYDQIVDDVMRRMGGEEATYPPVISARYFKKRPSLTIATLRVYCQARIQRDGDLQTLLFFEDLVSYGKEGDAMAALFGDAMDIVPWFGNGLLDTWFEKTP